jgi:pyrroloquinoline-quinone synthase
MSQQPHASKPVALSDELLIISREDSFADPMYKALRAGALSRQQLKLWMMQAMFVVRDFTRFISAIHANCPHRDCQQLLAENLWEEHGRGDGTRDHFQLVRRLVSSLGATQEEIDLAQPLPETTDYVEFCFQVTRERSFVEGMTAIGVGIESFMPAFFGALAEYVQRDFGLSIHDVQYLLVHVGEDEDHARRAMEMIDRYADTEEIKQAAKTTLREMLKIKRRFAEAIFRNCTKQ